jgi:hypothetical protein
MVVEVFDEPREFAALEACCTSKNVINGTHRNEFTAQRRLVPISVSASASI